MEIPNRDFSVERTIQVQEGAQDDGARQTVHCQAVIGHDALGVEAPWWVSSRNEGLGQIIVDRVILSVDIDALKGRRFAEIDILERAERLDLLIRR
jgi:hypothetical protein